jgi:hypothetical protein
MRPAVRSRARSHPDRGGDPLDGLVNLFDLGIVLAVAFLLAALSSLKLTGVLTGKEKAALVPTGAAANTIVVRQGQQVRTIRLDGRRVVGQGSRVGSVYRLADGRIVYVEGR